MEKVLHGSTDECSPELNSTHVLHRPRSNYKAHTPENCKTCKVHVRKNYQICKERGCCKNEEECDCIVPAGRQSVTGPAYNKQGKPISPITVTPLVTPEKVTETPKLPVPNYRENARKLTNLIASRDRTVSDTSADRRHKQKGSGGIQFSKKAYNLRKHRTVSDSETGKIKNAESSKSQPGSEPGVSKRVETLGSRTVNLSNLKGKKAEAKKATGGNKSNKRIITPPSREPKMQKVLHRSCKVLQGLLGQLRLVADAHQESDTSSEDSI